MPIAITGATGFLGRHIVRTLAQAGLRLRCWFRPQSDRGGFDNVAGSIEWVEGDLENVASMEQLVRGAEALVHAAVQWDTPGGQGAVGTNFNGSLQLFQTAFNLNVPRCVFISTCAVHGTVLGDRPLDEGQPLWPSHHYGACKAALEAFVHSFGLGNGWPICALRPSGIYGLARPVAASKWYDLVGKVMRGEPIATAEGEYRVHAEDVARAVELLLRADAKAIAAQSYICSDMYIAEQEVARLAAGLTGSKSVISDLSRGPNIRYVTGKLRSLGMTFGGERLIQRTVTELVEAHRSAGTKT